MNDSPIAPDRQAFYDRIHEHSLAPLWERLHALVTRTPTSDARPFHWNYDDVVRPFMMESGALITAREAERRVLILENPGLAGQSRITNSLFAGLQMIRSETHDREPIGRAPSSRPQQTSQGGTGGIQQQAIGDELHRA